MSSSSLLHAYLAQLKCVKKHALGPQQSLTSICTDDAEEGDDVMEDGGDDNGLQPGDESLWSTKSLVVLRVIAPGNAFSPLMIDACESFHQFWGTGSSSLTAWVVLLAEHALGHEERGESMDALLRVMETVEVLYLDMAQALAIQSVAAEEAEVERPRGDQDQDTSWFFLSDDAAEALALHQDPGILLALEGTKRDDEWLVRGLQHCCAEDYPPETTVSGVTLPMRLASQAAAALGSSSSGPPDEDEDIPADVSMQAVHARVHVILLPGVAAERSRAVVDGLVFRCEAHVCERLRLRQGQGQGQGQQRAVYHRCLVLDSETFEAGTGQGGGGSLLPGGSSATHVLLVSSTVLSPAALHDPTSAASLQFSPRALYFRRVAEVVTRLGVDLVLCADSAATRLVLDSLPCAIVALPPGLLRHAAHVAGCVTVGDILDADEGNCSRHAVSVSTVFFQDTQSPQALLQLERSCADLGTTFEEEEAGCACVSVVVCAPTAAQVRATADRFWRSLARLHHLGSSQVLPGGGLCELLVALHLEEEARHGSRELAGYALVMRSFVALLLCNAGATPAEGSAAMDAAAVRLTALLLPSESRSVLAAVQSLSEPEKTAVLMPLAPALGVAGDGHGALDVVTVKSGAMRAAVSAVRVMCLGSAARM